MMRRTAPTGQNEIAQGKAKRPPVYVGEWISAPLSSAPSGRDAIATFQPTGRCPGLSPCAPLGQKARNQGRSPRARVINTTDCQGFCPTVTWPSEAVRVRDESISLTHNGSKPHFTGRRGIAGQINALKKLGDSPRVFLPVRGSQRWISRPRLEQVSFGGLERLDTQEWRQRIIARANPHRYSKRHRGWSLREESRGRQRDLQFVVGRQIGGRVVFRQEDP